MIKMIFKLLYLCVFDTPLTSATTYNLALGQSTISDSVYSLDTPSSAVVDGIVTYCESKSNITSPCYENYKNKLFSTNGY